MKTSTAMHDRHDGGRRRLLAGIAVLCASPLVAWAATGKGPMVEVWKDPSCGCCKDWVEHLRTSGFTVKVHESGNGAARKDLGMPDRYGSCHTARVGGYAIEGHVPARDVRRLLKEKPLALGLAVPGMPIGSPGMDGPEYGGRRDGYQVLLVRRDGSSAIFQSYR
jgi:hypothetical protein